MTEPVTTEAETSAEIAALRPEIPTAEAAGFKMIGVVAMEAYDAICCCAKLLPWLRSVALLPACVETYRRVVAV
jgi:hypothetical protein